MFSSDLQGDFIPLEEVSRYADTPEDEEMYFGHYVSDLDKRCPLRHPDAAEAVLMLEDLFSAMQHLSPSTAAAIRYIRFTLLAQSPLPF